MPINYCNVRITQAEHCVYRPNSLACTCFQLIFMMLLTFHRLLPVEMTKRS